MRKEGVQVYIAVLFAMIFWGFSFIWSKMVFEVYRPVTTVLLRLVISSAFMWVVGLAFGKINKLRKKDLKAMILLTFYQPFLYFIGENIGLSMVSSTVAAVIIATIPLFTPVASYFFFKERVSVMNVLGILVSIFGVFLVIVKDNFSLKASPAGILLLLLAVVSAIAYSVAIKKFSRYYNAYSLITYQNTFGILMFLPVFLIFDYEHFMQAQITTEALNALLMLAIFASSMAFIFFTYGIQKLGITKANAISNMIPAFTAIFAFLVLGERLTLTNITGVLTVISGLFLSQIKFHFRKKPAISRYPKE